jgi:hypothetical protein
MTLVNVFEVSDVCMFREGLLRINELSILHAAAATYSKIYYYYIITQMYSSLISSFSSVMLLLPYEMRSGPTADSTLIM